MTSLEPTMEKFNQQNSTLDLRTAEGEAAKQQAIADKKAALQKQAAQSQSMQANGIDGMKSKSGFNNAPGVESNSGTPGLFTLPKDQIEHPPGEQAANDDSQNPVKSDQAPVEPKEQPKKGLFGKLFSK